MHFCLIFLFWGAASDQTSIFVSPSNTPPCRASVFLQDVLKTLGILNENVPHVDEINPAFTSCYSRQALSPLFIWVFLHFRWLAGFFPLLCATKVPSLQKRPSPATSFRVIFLARELFCGFAFGLFSVCVFKHEESVWEAQRVFLVGPYQLVGQLFYVKNCPIIFQGSWVG